MRMALHIEREPKHYLSSSYLISTGNDLILRTWAVFSVTNTIHFSMCTYLTYIQISILSHDGNKITKYLHSLSIIERRPCKKCIVIVQGTPKYNSCQFINGISNYTQYIYFWLCISKAYVKQLNHPGIFYGFVQKFATGESCLGGQLIWNLNFADSFHFTILYI